MSENIDNIPKLPSVERAATTEASISRPRKKRKWDQPGECLIPSGAATSGLLSMPTVGYPSVYLPGIMPTSQALNQVPLMQLQAAAVVQKLNQPKIQEDLVIAREIVINDADPAMRYKLTKRQTQDEIQKCTGAVVITRGKYRPPTAIPDGEKPLYLHISSCAHLKETADRVLSVDRAAAMVEDMLKQVTQPVSTCVYVGFDADPTLNIAARIRGPNDQYINHIINETGAAVVLRGHRSGYLSRAESEEGQQPLHLFLSSNNQKSLEDARLLAENLLDTISRECGATRVSSSKLYGAVPPPPQLLAGVQSSEPGTHSNLSDTTNLSCSTATTSPGISTSLVVAPLVPFGQGAQTGGMLPYSCTQTDRLLYSQPLPLPCTSYSAYAGLYPQVTPLPQVALALKQSSTVTSTVAPATLAADMVNATSSNVENRPPQRRKFQEAPTSLIVAAESRQGPALHATQPQPSRGVLTNYVSSRSMPPPPSRSMQPPKAISSFSANGVSKRDNISNTPTSTPVPDTLVKLMEYGDDDDDDEYDEVDVSENGAINTNPNQNANAKPFWAA